MNDLLAGTSPHRFSGDSNGDLEAGTTDTGMEEFLQEVGVIKGAMEQIRKNLQKLQEAHEESKTVTKAAAMKALKKRMEADVDEVSKTARKIKVKLEALDKSNMTNRKKPGCGEGSSIDRQRMSMTAYAFSLGIFCLVYLMCLYRTLKKKLKDLMGEFQVLRQKFQDEYREVVERRIFTVTGKRPEEETIERLIETGDSESIFQKAIQEQGRGQILDTVAEIQERHDAVKDMEKKLLELHQIFLDMAVLVEAQGEMIDNIETQVSKAVDHVNAGTTALKRTKKLQRSKRKWMCIAIIILLIVICVIVVGVIKPWNINKK